MTIIKDTDLFVVQSGDDNEVYNYSGQQLHDDINAVLSERDIKVYVQENTPFVSAPPDFATQRDLWYDTSVGAFFIAQYDSDGDYICWVITNPADHRKFLEVQSGGVTFPPADGTVSEFIHTNTGVKYYCKPVKNQWMDKDLPGLDTFVLREGDTMTGALQLPNLIVTGDDTVEAHIELNEGILTADDSVVGEEQRLYWNGDTVAKHEDVVRLTNTVVNIDQHIENITPYAYRGLLEFSNQQVDAVYSLYKTDGTNTDDHTEVEKIYISDTSEAIDVSSLTKGMYVEVQNTDGPDVLTGKVLDRAVAASGVVITLDVTRSQGTSVLGVKSHVRIFKVADSSDKPTVYFQPHSPDENLESVKSGQLWVDSSTNIQYIWTGEEWAEVGAACGGGSSTQIPVGTIWPYAGDISGQNPVPRGWLLCNGSGIDGRYVKLKELLGVDTVPDLRGKYLGGAGQLGLGGVRSEKTDFTRRPRLTEAYNSNNNLLFTASVQDKDLGSHRHSVGNISASTSGNDGAHSHSFKTESYNKTGGTNALRNEVGNNYNSPSQGSHNHTITMSGTSAYSSLGNHSHDLNINYKNWDEYTRPYTYVVHWIIKHD